MALNLEEAIKNVPQIETDGLSISYIGLQDFIRNKQASGRKQDLADIKEIEKKVKVTKKKGRGL